MGASHTIYRPQGNRQYRRYRQTVSRVEESSDTDNTKEEDYAEFGNEESVARLYIAQWATRGGIGPKY